MMILLQLCFFRVLRELRRQRTGRPKATLPALCTAAALLILLLLPFPKMAWSTPAGKVLPLSEGIRHFDAGAYEAAYRVFFNLFSADPGNPDLNFRLGRAAFEMGDYEAAVMAFERILITDPSLLRVKLELARSYFRMGDHESARRHFTGVLEADPPDTVRRNIRGFLARIDSAGKRHAISGKISAGIGWDDNPRIIPADENIRLPLPDEPLISLDPRKSDTLFTNTVILNHEYRPQAGRIGLSSSLFTYNAFYDDQDELDINYFGFGTGPTFREGDRLWEVHLLGYRLDQGYHRYLGALGAGGSLTVVKAPLHLIKLGAKYEDKRYYRIEGRDSDNYNLFYRHNLYIGPNSGDFHLSYEHENADDELFDYNRYDAAVRLSHRFSSEFTLFAGARFRNTRYESEDVLFGRKRSDNIGYLSAGFAKEFWRSADSRRRLLLQMDYTYTDARSNIELYQYTKNEASSAVSLEF